ncbi:nucleotidyltransferase family protein [Poseidonocella sp. HB161398]|uniref:nucleotidyltransferase family protein n=1 Tax=Poseidonocella sp. HB161398 TaxID=2320855 RepID=UPI00110999CB|nr:nucleotidyltransferase family protein [Poseidonocella sp. HB161398]
MSLRMSFTAPARQETPLDQLGRCLRGDPPADADWLAVISIANIHFAGPWLYRSLKAAPRTDGFDQEVLDYLEEIDDANNERNRRLLSQLAEITARLNAEGIVPRVFKGAAVLARQARPGDSPRMLSDLDLMVDESRGAEVSALLGDLGYELIEGSIWEHSVGSFFRDDSVGAVDLHTRMPANIERWVPPGTRSARWQTVRLGDAELALPDASLHFVINLLHDMLHDRGVISGFLELRYLLELADLAGNPAAPLDWEWIRDICRTPRLRLCCELQDRMSRHLLGKSLIPGCEMTLQGAILHRRRLFKARHDRLGRWEWEAILGAKRLGRRLRGQDPHGNPAS